jgi:hypothetical protein
MTVFNPKYKNLGLSGSGSGLSNSLDSFSVDPDPKHWGCTWSRQRVRQGGERRAHSGASLATQNTEIGATRRQCNVFFLFILTPSL